METLLLPFSPRYIILTICAVVTALADRHRDFRPQPEGLGTAADPDRDLRRAHLARHSRPHCRRTTRFCATIRSRRISASCSKKSARRCGSISSRARRTACRSPATPARWSISAPRCSSTSGRSAPRRTSTSEGYEWMHHSMAPKAHRGARIPRHHRRPGLHQAVFGLGLQHLGDEFWRAQPQRRARAERRRQEGRLRA